MPPALAALTAHYGDTWIAGLLHDWSAAWRVGGYGHVPERLEWHTGLPRLCAALTAAGSEARRRCRLVPAPQLPRPPGCGPTSR
ncbi:hypothetical protein ACQP1K_27595 [Sphaerimonospora sp. CA-214678]|uniref:hypothetical protein n=1 Tax=Sphaerimonospora sp. CA-214678 TaxID=3240029 RepID=UPI003D91D518